MINNSFVITTSTSSTTAPPIITPTTGSIITVPILVPSVSTQETTDTQIRPLSEFSITTSSSAKSDESHQDLNSTDMNTALKKLGLSNIKALNYTGMTSVYSCKKDNTEKSYVIRLYEYDNLKNIDSIRGEPLYLSVDQHPNLMHICGLLLEHKVTNNIIYVTDANMLETFKDDYKIAASISLKAEGDELLSLIQRDSKLTAQRIVKIITSLCEGIVALHEKGIVHRDLKPENIIVSDDDNAVIIDMDFCKQIGRNRTGSSASSMEIASPEFIRNFTSRLPKGYNIDTDLFSLGSILCCWLTGYYPCSNFKKDDINADANKKSLNTLVFSQESQNDKCKIITHYLLPKFYNVGNVLSATLINLTVQLLSENPKDRPSAQQVIDTLAPLIQQEKQPVEKKIVSTEPVYV